MLLLTHHLPKPRSRRAGVTLIELLIVIVIIALAASGLGVGFGALTRSYLRSACLKVVAASRFAYNRAILRGVTVRVLFDFDKGTLSIEEAEGPVLLARGKETKTKSAAEKKKIADGVIDPWKEAEGRLNKTFKPETAISPFQPIRGETGKVIERYAKQPIGDGISIAKLIVPHEADPVTQGQAAIYFFPAGITEPAVIQLRDKNDNVYSVELDVLSGSGKVYTEAFQPRNIEDQEDNSRLRDDG